jgi:hypothetical protein
MNRVCTLFGLAFVLCSLGLCSNAQTSCKTQVSCATYSLYDVDCIPALPPSAFNCASNGPWSVLCDIYTNQCSPVPCPTCSKAKASTPIDLATGNTYIEQSDIRVPGLGGGLELTRTWNSLGSGYGLFGEYWSSNFDEHVSVGSDHLIKQTKGSGAVWSYGWSAYTSDGAGSMYLAAGPRNDQSTLQVGQTTWTLTLKNGDKKIFARTTGVVLSVVDHNGNTRGCK